MSRHEAARHAVRAVVGAERIARSTAKDLAPFARAYSDGLVAALRKAKTPEAQRRALIAYATDKASPELLIYAIRKAAQDAEVLGAKSAAAEGKIPYKQIADEAKQTAKRLDDYAIETARRMRLGMLQQALDILKSNSGDSPQEIADTIAQALPMEWGQPESVRVALVAKTVATSAMQYGRMKVLRRPILQRQLPYWMFTAVLDANTSDMCWECDKVVLPNHHKWWLTHAPLLHFHCRSVIHGITEAQARKIGITKDPPKVEAAEGWGKLTDLATLPKRPKHIDKALLDATP